MANFVSNLSMQICSLPCLEFCSLKKTRNGYHLKISQSLYLECKRETDNYRHLLADKDTTNQLLLRGWKRQDKTWAPWVGSTTVRTHVPSATFHSLLLPSSEADRRMSFDWDQTKSVKTITRSSSSCVVLGWNESKYSFLWTITLYTSDNISVG